MDFDLDRLLKGIRSDDNLVREFRLEVLRETLALRYSSYILALAMGAGKTVLIGAIIASEFAMSQEYPTGPFIQNALVFAPGKTIIESLRELAEVPYDKILPPRLYRPFASSVKLTFTRDGEKDIPVIRGSSFNVVVTNTEKIRIQKETIRKSDVGSLFASRAKEVSGSIHSQDNHHTLDRELQETYGETIAELNVAQSKSRRAVIRLHKVNLPPLVIKQTKRTVVRKEGAAATWRLTKPTAQDVAALKKTTFEMTSPEARRGVLQ